MKDPVAPRLSHIRAALCVAAALLVTGCVVGALWALLAPGVHGAIADTRDNGRVFVYLGDQADNFFVGAALLVGMMAVASTVAAVAAWQWRAHRGPAMAVGLILGSLVGAEASAGVGAGLARLRYGALDVAGAVLPEGHRIAYVVEAPAVFFGHAWGQVAATLAVAPMIAAVTYAFCVVACARDDLGSWPPVTFTPPVVPEAEAANAA